MTTRRMLLGGALAAPLAAGLSLATATPASIEANKTGPRTRHFPNVPLQTHSGKTVRFYDDLIADKVVVCNMMYTTCNGFCPISTVTLRMVQQLLSERIGKDVFIYSLSIDPQHDTPSVLRAYMRKFQVDDNGWTFLTGKSEDVTLVRTRLGFYDIDDKVDNERITHTGMLRIGNEALDRWCMQPVVGKPADIARTVLRVIPSKSPSSQLLYRDA